jgi:hypothetical protein
VRFLAAFGISLLLNLAYWGTNHAVDLVGVSGCIVDGGTTAGRVHGCRIG